MHNDVIEQCTGKGTKIVLIDCGRCKDINCISVCGEKLVFDDIACTNIDGLEHAQHCANIVKKTAPNAEIEMVSVGDNLESLNEENIIKALCYCIDISPDIIIMPFSLESVSNDFSKLIQDLFKNKTLICASISPTYRASFPHKMKEVISVDVMSDNGVSNVAFTFYDDVFYVAKKEFEEIYPEGSSMAVAYMGGFFAKIKEFNRLSDTISILEYYRNVIRAREQLNENKKKAYYLNAGQHSISEFTDMILPEYEYYYDETKKQFVSIKNGECVANDDIDEVDVICGDDFQVRLPFIPSFFRGKIHYYENITDDNCNYIFNSSLKNINIPNIYIGSYGVNMDKLFLQLGLSKYLKSMGIKVGNITYNPIGRIFGFNYLKYPPKILFPDYFYFLNNEMEKEARNKDIILSSMPGSVDRFISFEHMIAGLPYVFAAVAVPDLVILSISAFVEESELKIIKRYIEVRLGAKLLLYVTQKNRDDEYYTSNRYNTKISNEDAEKIAKRISLTTHIKTFTEKDINDGRMFTYIYKMFS